MEQLLTMDAAGRACGLSRDTIKRRLRAGQFPGAVRGEAYGSRPPPWLIPLSDLVAAGLTAPRGPVDCDAVDPDDLTQLREALARQRALAEAREDHLLDLRTEIRRLNDKIDALTNLLGRIPGCADGVPARDCARSIAPHLSGSSNEENPR